MRCLYAALSECTCRQSAQLLSELFMKGMKIKEMKNNFKRFLAFALAMVMVFAYVPAGVFATGEATESDTAPALPTVNVTEDENENANFGVKFKADVLSDAQENYYGTWNVDVVITLNRDATMTNSFQNKGQFCPTLKCVELLEDSNWTVFEGSHAESEVLKAGTPWSLLGYIRGFEGMSDMALLMSSFAELSDGLSVGADLNPDYLTANPGLKATVELVLTNPDDGETVTIAEYQYESPNKAPDLPTATITKIANENLTFALNFKAGDVSEEQLEYYGGWYADFELTVNTDVTFNADGSADGYLSGRYDAWNNGAWVNVPIKAVELKAGESLKIMEYAATLMNQAGLKLTYAEVIESVKNFDCGVYLDPEFLKENSDFEVTLSLNMYDPNNEDEPVSVGEPHVFTAADLEKPAMPTATVTEIENDKLTFAMNFKADEITDEQLAYYGAWYADYELTVNKEVTFDANGTGDGWLSGQYDASNEYYDGQWINVPFKEPVTLEAGQTIKIMEFAAELMGEPGLKYTYKEVYEGVKDFDCGVYFTPEFLLANPDLEVTLNLKMYHPTNAEESCVIGETYVFNLEDFIAINTKTGKCYTDVSDALEAAASDDTVKLLKNAEDWIVTVLEATTLDLNGFTLKADYVACFGDIVDNSDANTGLLNVVSNHFLIQEKNAQLPVNTADGYLFAEVLKFNEDYNGVRYAFQPVVEGAAVEALKAGKDTSGVTVEVQISWNKGTRRQSFVFSEDKTVGYFGSYNSATGKFSKMFTLGLTGADNLEDLQFQAEIRSNTGVVCASTDKSGETETKTEQTLTNSDGNSAEVPAGVLMESGATALTLTTTEMERTNANITVADGETARSIDVHVEGLSANNTTPIIVTLPEFAPNALNQGNLELYHVENGVTNAMIRVSALEDVDAHNEYYYDIATGTITMALASFSEVAARSNDAKVWNGNYDYDWYTRGLATDIYEIYNADQLAAFGTIVGGMNGQTQDSFSGKTVKLMADINLGDKDNANDSLIFYPIGYWNNTGSYEKQAGNAGPDGTAVSSGFYPFEGTFDGNGNTISNFYQNTWEMFGDYNDDYEGTPNHFRDGMGLFGKVYGGTVKNLTVENFSSDGEFTTTGVIAAYADSYTDQPAVFENIAIFNCNPRVYNIGNGGIVGCAGWYSREASLGTADYANAVTFRNITVDQSNKISALWGSYDVSCGGILGQYYPNSGCGIKLDNCHVAAVMDVNNDVCGNYQYYWYRYSGMFIGTIRANKTEGNYTVADTTGITAENCTYTMGDWNEYWYCELVKNTKASYTHDHQFSRLTKIESLEEIKSGDTWLKEGNFVIPNADNTAAECYHIFKDANGELYQHFHNVADESNPEIYESFDLNGDGELNDLKEDRQCYFIPFNQLLNGLGYGVKATHNFEGMTQVEDGPVEAEAKFKVKADVEGTYFEPGAVVKLGDLFELADGVDKTKISIPSLNAFASPVDDETQISATFTLDKSDWENSTLTFADNCNGEAKITITDYYFCEPATITIQVGQNEDGGDWA